MDTNSETPRMIASSNTNAVIGKVVWAPVKSLWYSTHLLIAIIGGYYTFSLSALTLFVIFTCLTICLGHSLGMHRRFIHNSYECPLWVEHLFVHLGVLVGMAGPLGMMHQHDLRDWAQRNPQCHTYLRHGEHILKDYWWQLHCDLQLEHPPQFRPEPRVANGKFYTFTERTWMLQQLPWALALFCVGGVSWVVWGISARVVVSVTGHWLIGFFAHNQGARDWHVSGAAVQGYNLRIAALISMGEAWHNNHHAFPGSAVLGIYEGQSDPGWRVLNAMHNLGLAWDIKTPTVLATRGEVTALGATRQPMKALETCPLLALITKTS
jgi:fatty-acid desaturase